MLGFLLRITTDFTNWKCINLLYNALVRSNLEYCTAVWSPYQQIHITNIERIQRRYTRTLHFRLGLQNQSYDERLKTNKMLSLGHRRVYFDMCLLFDILHDVNNKMYAKLNFRNANHLNRHNYLFYPPFARTDYKKYRSPTGRMQNVHCKSFRSLDLFGTRRKFKKALRLSLSIQQGNLGWNTIHFFQYLS